MHHRRRLVALTVILAALGAAPATAAAGRADHRPGTPAHADRRQDSASTWLTAAAGDGTPWVERGDYADGRGPGEDKGPGPGKGRKGGADRTDPFVLVASATAGAGALVALVLSVARALRRRRG
ncbi:hypothetical protein ABZX90_08335 [Streptomyces sp. NPDC002935]|uniref:hypothetical protein n=1 Tax=unclassified Streptomyces TaxID=2593676 RepID=UPI0033349FC1